MIRKNRKDTELIILGQGPNLQSLINKTVSLQLVGIVHFLGFKDNPYKFLSHADCFCLTSVWEGLPQVIAEAMICRVPVISVDCESGPREMIIDKETGFLLDENDNNLFVKLTCKLLDDKLQRDIMVEKAFNFAVKEYSITKCTDRYLEIINSIL